LARIWDCDPKWLNGKHLVSEHQELGRLFCDILKPILGRRGYYTNHYEAKRFDGRLELLVARDDFLVREAISRNYNFRQSWIEVPELYISLESTREHDIDGWSWIKWAAAHDWPRSYNDEYWAPWKRDRMKRTEYVMLGKNWSKAYKNGERPDPDLFHVPVR
jgi:hypothetical protein